MEHSESNPTDFRKTSYLELLQKFVDAFRLWVTSGSVNRNFALRSACICDPSPCLILITEIDCVLFMVRADGEEAAGVLNRKNRALSIINLNRLRDMYKYATFLSARLRDIDCTDCISVATVGENLHCVCGVNVEGNVENATIICIFRGSGHEFKSIDTNRANAPYVFTLLWVFPKLFVALLFIYLLDYNQEISSQMGSECL